MNMHEFEIRFVGPFGKKHIGAQLLDTLKTNCDILYHEGGRVDTGYTMAGIEIRPEESLDKEALKADLRDIFEQILDELL